MNLWKPLIGIVHILFSNYTEIVFVESLRYKISLDYSEK